jgi:hypothetical protein
MSTLNVLPSSPAVGDLKIDRGITYRYQSTGWEVIDVGNAAAASGDAVHVQSVAATTWTINHNFGKYPVVQVYGTDGKVFAAPEITHLNANTLTIGFDVPTAGTAILVTTGTNGPVTTSTTSTLTAAQIVTLIDSHFTSTNWQGGSQTYTHSQPIAASTWVVNHNLGFKPVIQAYTAAGVSLGVLDITHNSNNQATLVFASSVAGEARCI